MYQGGVHTADHEAILDRGLFDAVQSKLAANNVEKKLRLAGLPYLLTGLIFDSAGNRMSPSHTVKKGVRYRYYVSQAIQQRRDKEAGIVGRVPAPEVEALVGALVANRAKMSGTLPDPEILGAHVGKIAVHANTLEISLRPVQEPAGSDPEGFQAPETVHLGWARKPFVAAIRKRNARGGALRGRMSCGREADRGIQRNPPLRQIFQFEPFACAPGVRRSKRSTGPFRPPAAVAPHPFRPSHPQASRRALARLTWRTPQRKRGPRKVRHVNGFNPFTACAMKHRAAKSVRGKADSAV